MKKYISFIISILLGIIYQWLGILIYPYLPFDVDFGLLLIILPTILCIISISYFIKKKLGPLPIVGLFLGIFIGIIIAGLALKGL